MPRGPGRTRKGVISPEQADVWRKLAEMAEIDATLSESEPGIPDDDSPELTSADVARARPASEAVPHIVEAWRRSRGRPKSDAPKTQVTLRLSQEVLEHFKAGGPGWQTRIDDTLKKVIRS